MSLAALLLAAVAAAAGPGSPAGGTRPTIAVPDLIAERTPGEDAAVLSQFVRTAVVKSDAFSVVDKNNMEKVLAEQAFQQTGCTSQECAVKLGRILRVDRILIGTYGVFADTRYLSAQIVEVETGRIMAAESLTIPAGEKIEETAGRLVRNLLASQPAAGAPAPAAAPLPARPDAPDQRPWIGEPPDAAGLSRPTVDERNLPRQRSPWVWVVVATVLVAVFGGVLAAHS